MVAACKLSCLSDNFCWQRDPDLPVLPTFQELNLFITLKAEEVGILYVYSLWQEDSFKLHNNFLLELLTLHVVWLPYFSKIIDCISSNKTPKAGDLISFILFVHDKRRCNFSMQHNMTIFMPDLKSPPGLGRTHTPVSVFIPGWGI